MNMHNIQIFFETSAKNNINVEKAYDEIAKQLFLSQVSKRRTSKLDYSEDNKISLGEESSEKK